MSATFDAQTATAQEFYAHLKASGSWAVPAARATSVVPALRRQAKADGLVLVTWKEGGKHLTSWQRRQRATHVALTTNGVDIYFPPKES